MIPFQRALIKEAILLATLVRDLPGSYPAIRREE